MADEKKPHPLALGGNRPAPSGKGRPRKKGDRYPNGRLKPQGPNQLVIERRKAMCEDITKATSPLDVAHYRGWLDDADYRTGLNYARLHVAAGFGSKGRGGGREVADALQVSVDVNTDAKSFFSSLPHAEVVALWDAVFDDDGERAAKATERAEKANRLWRAANAALTAAQRQEVYRVCVLDSFPQWILQRAAGRMDTSWEGQRKVLLEGLRAIRQTTRPAQKASVCSMLPPDPQPIAAMRVAEREVRVVDGVEVLQVERVARG